MRDLKIYYPGFLSVLLGIFGMFDLKAQQPLHYYSSNGFPVSIGGNALSNPWTGGFNNGQMVNLDVNNDGIQDLILFDTDFNDVQVFIKKGSTYVYSVYLSRKLPKMRYLMRVADLNNDGKPDLFTESETFTLKVYLNVTELSDSIIQFVPQGVYSPITDESVLYYRTRNIDPSEPWFGMSPLGIESADIPYIGDVDQDGDIDIIKFDGTYNSYSLFKDVSAEKGLTDTFEFQDMEYCFGYFYEDNFGDVVFDSCGYTERLQPRHSSGASSLAYDADSDGDMDLLVSSGVFNYLTFLGNAKANENASYDSMFFYDTLFPRESVRANQLFFPSLNGIDYNEDGIIDIGLAPTFFESKQSQNNLFLYEGYKEGDTIKHRLDVNSPMKNLFLDVGAYASPALIDIDRDGDLDLLVASETNEGALGSVTTFQLHYFENQGTAKEPYFVSSNSNYLNISQYGIIYPRISCGDLNGDGHIDLLVGDNSGKLFYFKNTSLTGLSTFTMESSTFIVPPSIWESVAAPTVYDYNGDALPDLLMGLQSGYVNLYKNTGSIASPSFILEQDSAWYAFSNRFQTNVIPPQFQNYGYSSPWAGDMDNDGKDELILAGQLGQIYRYAIDGTSPTDSLSRESNMFWTRKNQDSLMAEFGGYSTIAVGDLDGDSISEIIVGTKNGGLKMLSAKGDQLLSSDKLTDLSYFIYPNPATNKVIVRMHELEKVQWSMYSSHGVEVLKGHNTHRNFEINTSTLPDGLYFIHLYNAHKQGIKKLMLIGE